MADSKAMLPKLSQNWADAKKFNAQRVLRRLKAESGDLDSKENLDHNMNTVFHQQSDSQPTITRPAIAVSVTMSEDEEDQTIPGRSASDNDTTNVSAWAMMEHYDWSRDAASKRSVSSNREEETHSSQISGTEEDARELDVGIPENHLLTTTMIEWQENDNGELIEPSIHDDSSSNESVAISQTGSASFSGQIGLIEGIVTGVSDTKQEIRVYNSKTDISQSTATRVREKRDFHPGHSALAVQMSFEQDDGSSHGNFHNDDVGNFDESITSNNDGKVSVLSIQSSLFPANKVASKQHNKDNVDNQRTCYLSKIEKLENDLRNQKKSTATVQSKLKDRVVELEQALRVTAATPRGTVVQENPLKTLLDRNQTLVKEVRFADQTCVELSSRVTSLEEEKKALLERVEQLERENAELKVGRQHTEGYGNDKKDSREVEFSGLNGKKPSNTVANTESLISASNDLCAEMSRVSKENNSWRQQVVSMQNQLDTYKQELEEERKKSQLHKNQLTEGVKSAESFGSSMGDDARKLQLLSFEQELKREKAVVASLKKELITLRTMQQDNPEFCGGQGDFETMQLVSGALSEMQQRYAGLEDRVLPIFDVYISRLGHLTKKVEVLKSSLHFEAEPQPIMIKNRQHRTTISGSFLSTPSTKEDVLELMEEARIPGDSHIDFHDDDSSIRFEDISNFAIDDDTLGSVTKNRSITTDEGHTRWKEQLEAVLHECNRVKKRSTELRDEIVRQKSTIEVLEGENGKLSLQSSRKSEEIEMVEQALLEARKVIAELEDRFREANDENENSLKSLREKDVNIALLQKSVQRSESDCTMEETKRQILEKRTSELEVCLEEKTKMLDEATQLSSTYKAKNAQLTIELSKTREEVRESVDSAISELQVSLKEANEYIEDLKIKNQEAIDDLSEAVEFNTSQKKQIDELQAEKKKRASDVEDSILESQCSLETIRRERAELRSKLSKRDAELSGLREMFTKYKETSQIQLDKRLKLVQTLQSEKADVLFHCENLHIMRREFLGLIMSIDLFDNFTTEVAADQSEGFKDCKSIHLENEILFWRDILQHVGGVLRALPKRNKDYSEAVDKIESLTNRMAVLKKSENDCKVTLSQERKQNDKLCSLLGQAEFEMERSALQIQEMSAALSHLQQNEAKLSEKIRTREKEYSSCSEQLVSLQKEVSNERKEIQKEKIELEETLKEQESQLVETTAELSATKSELEKIMDYQQSQATIISSQEEKIMASESKCKRLREYIQKLTKKCEEWEKSYDQQFKCIEKLRRKNTKVLDKGSEIAKKYHKLKADAQRKRTSHHSDREKWSSERSNIQAVHIQLEEELDLIAKELNLRWHSLHQLLFSHHLGELVKLRLSKQHAKCLDQISAASGTLELAGASVEDLTQGDEALVAASKWCGAADGLICTYDGCDDAGNHKAAIRLAVQSVSRGVSGVQIAVLASADDLVEDVDNDGIAGALGSFFRDSPKVPPTLTRSLASSPYTLRHGELFGKPESSPDFSPLVGGLRREPIITEEYTMRGVRVDPFIISNSQASSSIRTSRHAIGEAAALLAISSIALPKVAACISSQTGSQKVSTEEWNDEFARMDESAMSGKGSSLFSQEMVVDDTERLADWLASKWAPAVLRTYDIAAIRIGGRPVYAKRLDSGMVEIVWQELVDFQSRVIGRMILEVRSNGIEAKRGPGDATDGFGSISVKQLPGEEVLVNRLADAAAQAVDKGLARKARSKAIATAVKPAPVRVTTLESSGAVDGPVKEAVSETGPRKAGARRSTPRRRKTAGNDSSEA
ncbi:unnamed protein product [Cylindrotheca closterium]|uniref:Uncharacterized protein n=1 Tax=Cylindrotheca closterium TaxID=2856 RepID=A0AAD2JGF6_9STRA|nr:unnamed protein product [Cylindrotheca closterium]